MGGDLDFIGGTVDAAGQDKRSGAETVPLAVRVVLAVRVLARTRRASRAKRRRFMSGSPQ
jgi:hypothetical protein